MPFPRFICGQATTKPPKRERRKEARPGELLNAALDLFVEKGFAATRAEEVAARAGVSKGTLFLYFSSKEELFKAVVRDTLSGRFAEWREEFERFEGTSSEMLAYCLQSWWERIGVTKASGITKLMMSESHNFPDLAAFYQQEVIVPARLLLRDVLQRGIDRGEFRSLNLDYAVYALVAPIILLSLWQHSAGACVPTGNQLSPQVFLSQQIDLLLNGLVLRSSSAAQGDAVLKAPGEDNGTESSSQPPKIRGLF
jgi:AcrR family transcriptional regulator